MQFVECLASIIRELLLVKSETAFNSVLGAIDIDCIIESLCVSQTFFTVISLAYVLLNFCVLLYDTGK